MMCTRLSKTTKPSEHNSIISLIKVAWDFKRFQIAEATFKDTQGHW